MALRAAASHRRIGFRMSRREGNSGKANGPENILMIRSAIVASIECNRPDLAMSP
jgi:hypothetical protein